jgi:hypothetical protein
VNNPALLAARQTLACLPWAEGAWIFSGATLAAGLSTVVERHADGYLAVERAFLGGCLGLALPIASLLLVKHLHSAAVGPTQGNLARFGASRRDIAVGTHAVVMLSLAVLGGWLAVCVALVGGTPIAQLIRYFGIGALGGAGYGAWFCWASSFKKPGRARLWALLADWLFGLGTGGLALLGPRAHLRGMAGGPSVLEFSPQLSGVCLACLAICYLALTWRRLPR